MSNFKLTIDDIFKQLKGEKITPTTLVEESLQRAKKYQQQYNAFVTLIETASDEAKQLKGDIDNPLYGVPYALKDNIATKGILTTGSSNILKEYRPVFDATVVSKLKKKKAILIGKTVLDELAMGGSGTTGHTGKVYNPWDPKRIIGGSSAGSTAAVALGIVPFALGSDTGNSIRRPAAFGGVVGFKPTYGRISRFGLFPLASSLDHIGCLTRSVKDAAYVVDAIKGHDKKDMTTLPDDDKVYAHMLDGNVRGKKLCYIKEIIDLDNDNKEWSSIINNFKLVIKHCEELGMVVEPVTIDKQLLKALYPAYLIISGAEATSNNANLTGLLFGNRGRGNTIDDIIFDARTKGFSRLIKQRFIFGSYVLQKENQANFFRNAQRLRRMIVEQINDLFKIYDGLILPAARGIAPLLNKEIDDFSDFSLLSENHLLIGNFGGFPSITIPSGLVDEMPIGVNITGRILEDDIVLNIAYALETKLGLKGIIARGGREDV